MKSLFQRREKHLNEIIYTAHNNQHIIREAGATAAMNTPFYYYYFLYIFFHALLFSPGLATEETVLLLETIYANTVVNAA